MTTLVGRLIGIIVCLSPAGFLVASLYVSATKGSNNALSGIWFMALALPIAIYNFYLAFVRNRILQRRLGSLEGIPNVSVYPMIGTILITIGATVGFGAWGTSIVGLILLTLDVGGLPWFLVATWHESSFWGGE